MPGCAPQGCAAPPSAAPSSQALFEAGHATVDELAAEVQRTMPDVSLSTIYRTLEALDEAGLVTHAHLHHGSPTYHSVDEEPHVHLVCTALRCHRPAADVGGRVAGGPAAGVGGVRRRRVPPGRARAVRCLRGEGARRADAPAREVTGAPAALTQL